MTDVDVLKLELGTKCTCSHGLGRHNIAKKSGSRYCMKEYCACPNFQVSDA